MVEERLIKSSAGLRCLEERELMSLASRQQVGVLVLLEISVL